MNVTNSQALSKAKQAAVNRLLREQMRAEREDPQLPFILVHRSFAHRALLLAGALKLPFQQVRGALLMVWELLADRRILAGKTELVWSAEEARRHFHVVFDGPVDLSLLVVAGFLEERSDGYRLRGFRHLLRAQAMADGKAVTS